jgi:hypothetical protein
MWHKIKSSTAFSFTKIIILFVWFFFIEFFRIGAIVWGPLDLIQMHEDSYIRVLVDAYLVPIFIFPVVLVSGYNTIRAGYLANLPGKTRILVAARRLTSPSFLGSLLVLIAVAWLGHILFVLYTASVRPPIASTPEASPPAVVETAVPDQTKVPSPSPSASPSAVANPPTLTSLCPIDAEGQRFGNHREVTFISQHDLYADINNSLDLRQLGVDSWRCAGSIGTAVNKDIAVTESHQYPDAPDTLKFILPKPMSSSATHPLQLWVVMTASHTTNKPELVNQTIGYVTIFDPDNHEISRLELRLGQNIADWTYRDRSVTTFDPTGSVRVYRGYDSAAQNGRAAQLLAIPVTLPNTSVLKRVEIKDAQHGDPGFNVAGLLIVPVQPQASPPPQAPDAFEALCLEDWDRRAVNTQQIDVVDLIKNTELSASCNSTNLRTTELAPMVPFRLSKIINSRTSRSTPNQPATIRLTAPSPVLATRLYLLVSARNLCHKAIPENDKELGKIVISYSEHPQDEISLVAGETVREGRTNFRQCDPKLLSFKANNTNSKVQVIPGFPVKAVVSPDTGSQEAELWLDLLIIQLEPHAVSAIDIQDTFIKFAPEDPFLTIYAATFERAPER